MVPTSKSVRSYGLLTGFLALALLVPGTSSYAGDVQTKDSQGSTPGVMLALSSQAQQLPVQPLLVKNKQRKKLTKQELRQNCAQLPGCRATMEARKKGKHSKPIPSIKPGSPEEKLHPIPPRKSRGHRQQSQNNSRFSWVDVFGVSEAHAQTSSYEDVIAGAPYYYHDGTGVVSSLEIRNYGGDTRIGKYNLHGKWPGPRYAHKTPTIYNYLPFHINVPVTGYYNVLVKGTKQKRLHFRVPHNSSTIKTVDLRAASLAHLDYQELFLLAAGSHWIYMYVGAETSTFELESIQVSYDG